MFSFRLFRFLPFVKTKKTVYPSFFTFFPKFQYAIDQAKSTGYQTSGKADSKVQDAVNKLFDTSNLPQGSVSQSGYNGGTNKPSSGYGGGY